MAVEDLDWVERCEARLLVERLALSHSAPLPLSPEPHRYGDQTYKINSLVQSPTLHRIFEPGPSSLAPTREPTGL